ncbi:MAG: hypothetical protein DWQ09_00185 [Proteobacteria bacterium]|nr:MAG: hypothetical protein DWQ09_00185 [Pseudomonadota bacterium]
MHPLTLAVITFVVMLTGCSDQDKAADSKRDHIWKSQTQSIEKARSAEEEIRKAFSRRDREADQQSR